MSATSPRLAIADDTPLAFVTQTTLSVDDTRAIIAALRRRFTDLVGPDTKDICYATQNRQTAVRELSKLVDVILVVGASNSSNSNRLREIGLEEGVPSYLVGSGAELDPSWVEGAEVVGITAGASAPEELVEDLVETLAAQRPGRGQPAAGHRRGRQVPLAKRVARRVASSRYRSKPETPAPGAFNVT